MKRIVACVVVLLLCASIALPVAAADFTPSVTNKPAPEIGTVTTPDGSTAIGILYDENGEIIDYLEEGCLVITAVADAETSTDIPEDAKTLLLDVYNKLTSGEMALPYERYDSEMDPEDMVIRDLFDASFLCEDHPEVLEAEGNTMKVTLDLGVKPGVEVVIMTYVDGEWNPIVEATNNGDGTVTCVFEEICPIAVSIPVRDAVAETGDVFEYHWLVLAVVSLAAIVVLTVIYRRSMMKNSAN